MRHIVLVTISLDNMAGGLEKNFILLANHFAQTGKEVHLITFDLPEASAYYELDSKVSWHRIARTQPHQKISFNQRLLLLSRFRKCLKRLSDPIVICFHHGILARVFFASFGLRLAIICSERNSLGLYKHIVKSKKWSLSFLLLTLTKRITVQFASYLADYPFWLQRKIVVIPNPIFQSKSVSATKKMMVKGRCAVLHVGRLCDQKNQALLVHAFADISKENPLWDLYLVGEGGSRRKLESIISCRGLTGRVFLLGARDDVPDLLRRCNIFCMPSKWEGFPNALAEAMAHGLPCIGLKTTPGVNNLITDGESGILCDEAGLAAALHQLMRTPELRSLLGKAASSSVVRYKPEESFFRWDQLLAEFSK